MSNMYSAMAVADVIIDRCTRLKDPVSNLRLQKLLYFVWVDYYRERGRALFYDQMYAWKFGPVVPEVYYEYCAFGGGTINFRCESELEPEDQDIVERIIDKYRLVPVSELVKRTHAPETAWSEIYKDGEGNRNVIPFDLIKRKEFGENYVPG